MDMPTDTPARQIQHKPDCPHCRKATPSAQFDDTCHGCIARSIAASPAAWRAARGQTDTEIRAAIIQRFGEAGYRAGRLAVWDWMKRLGVVKPT